MTEQNETPEATRAASLAANAVGACFCPNCNEPAKKIGNEIFCESCDATFEIKKTGAAKVKAVGEIEELKTRVGALEAAILPDDEPEPAAEPAEPTEPEPTEPEEDILPG